MKITVESTAQVDTVEGASARVWEGSTDKGVPIKVWIAVISPQTHDEEAHAQFVQELQELKGTRTLSSFDIRLVI